MDLSFVDGTNMELLLRILLACPGAKAKHIKLLTNSSFARDFVQGRPEFAGLEVVSNLQNAMDGLLADYDPQVEMGEGKAELLASRVLSAQTHESSRETVEMRFQGETRREPLSLEAMRELGASLSIAVVDDDFVIQELIKTTFGAIGASVSAFEEGALFIEAAKTSGYDLVFLDLLMPSMNGFEVLSRLRAEDIDLPVTILSAVSHRDAVMKAFQAGVKSYLIKPLKPDQILTKTLEILKANF